MDCEMIRKMTKYKAWIKAEMPCENLTPYHHFALVAAIIYIMNHLKIICQLMMSLRITIVTNDIIQQVCMDDLEEGVEIPELVIEHMTILVSDSF